MGGGGRWVGGVGGWVGAAGGWVGGEGGRVGGLGGWLVERGDQAHPEKFYGGGNPPIDSSRRGHPATILWGVPPHRICTTPYEKSNSMGGSPPIENPMKGDSWMLDMSIQMSCSCHHDHDIMIMISSS